MQEDLFALQTGIREVEHRLETFDRSLFSLRVMAGQRMERVLASYRTSSDPSSACPSPFGKKFRTEKKSVPHRNVPSPCLFALPQREKRRITPATSIVKLVKTQSPYLVSFGEIVETEDGYTRNPSPPLFTPTIDSSISSDSYAMTDDSESDGEQHGSKKTIPAWALKKPTDLRVNPDDVFEEIRDDLYEQRKVGFSCHLGEIFNQQRKYDLRGDSGNWHLTNL